MSIACLCECGHSVSGVCLDRIPQCFKLIKNLEPMKSLLQQFKAGEIAAKNDVEPEQLNRLLKWAAPDMAAASGNMFYYFIKNGEWDAMSIPDNRIITPASQLLAELDALETPSAEQEFKWGEEVEVSLAPGDDWHLRIFCCTNPVTNANYKYLIVDIHGRYGAFNYIRRPVPTITITLDEAKQHAAKALGTTADKIIINHE